MIFVVGIDLLVVVALATLRAGTTLTTLRAGATLTTLAAGGTLLVALGLLNEHAVRQFVLARLGVNLQEFHLYVVTLLDAGFLDGLQALPVNL